MILIQGVRYYSESAHFLYCHPESAHFFKCHPESREAGEGSYCNR